jgi:hypothetical protein
MNKILIILMLFLISFANAQTANFPTSRPDDKGEPTKVLVGFYIADIEAIDSKDQSFTLDLFIRLKWKDSRLSDAKGLIPLNTIWQPSIQIFNLRDIETRFPEAVTILEDGTVQYTQRYHATLSSQLDFKNFPFDVQTLPITLVSFGYSPDEVELIYENAGIEKKFSISDWSVEPIGSKRKDFQANLFDNSTEKIVRPGLEYEFKATRYIHFYWWKVLAPMMVILFLSWAVFWIDPTQVGAQIGVSGTSILTLIAFLYKLDNVLPPVSYLTHLDHFIFTALVLVFIAYIEALVSITNAHKGRKEFARRLDLIFRIGYPVIFFIVIYIFWIK